MKWATLHRREPAPIESFACHFGPESTCHGFCADLRGNRHVRRVRRRAESARPFPQTAPTSIWTASLSRSSGAERPFDITCAFACFLLSPTSNPERSSIARHQGCSGSPLPDSRFDFHQVRLYSDCALRRRGMSYCRALVVALVLAVPGAAVAKSGYVRPPEPKLVHTTAPVPKISSPALLHRVVHHCGPRRPC